MKRLLITTLAEYQTKFWAEVGSTLCADGHEVTFIAFDDRSAEMLLARGFRVHSVTSNPLVSDVQAKQIIQHFDINTLNYWLSHERFAFNIRDGMALRRKLASAILAADQACKEVLVRGPAVMIQELGGFLSVVGCFHAARANGMDHFFIEPSFFRGRLFFLRNTFRAMNVPDDFSGSAPDELQLYLAETLQKGLIVVPKKDRHQYTTAWRKVVSLRNSRRLVEKLVDKFWHGKRQEFGYIGMYVRMHALMVWNSWRLRSKYTLLEHTGPIVYYPLHVPGDMALTLRSPHLLDQLSLVDQICRSVPATHCVAIKEHPAMVGSVDAGRLIGMLNRYDNLIVLPPSTNNFDVLLRCDAVVTINSKSGMEGALVGKPVIVLGDAFYTNSPNVRKVQHLQDLPVVLTETLTGNSDCASPEALTRYLSALWERSFPGELYVVDRAHIAQFSKSMVLAIST